MGQSDVDIIRDQQDALKKVINNIEEKIMKGGHIITALDDHRFNLTNELYQVIKGNQAQLNGLSIRDLTADIQRDLQFAQYLYQSAKSTLGITDTYQGKPDYTATSGVAKQMQINQTSGRMMSKQSNKYKAYADLFMTMFEFKLAFYDETRPYMKMGRDNRPEYGEFNKYLFLEQDASGAWYYNTDFIIKADSGQGIPRDKMWLWEQSLQLFDKQAMDNIQLWTFLENLGYPMAGDIKDQLVEQKQIAEQQAQQQQMQQGQPMPPEGQQPPPQGGMM
jgi:hypothetical protein